MRFRALAAIAATIMLGAVPASGQYLTPSGFTRMPITSQLPIRDDTLREKPPLPSANGANRWRPPAAPAKNYSTGYPQAAPPTNSKPSEVIDTPSSRPLSTKRYSPPVRIGPDQVPHPATAVQSCPSECPCGGQSDCKVTTWDGWGCPEYMAPRWLFTADALLLAREGTRPLALTRSLSECGCRPDLSSPDLGTAAGPRLALRYRGEEGEEDLEGIYFGIHDWTATSSEGPFHLQYASRLDSAELNVRRAAGEGISVLAGFRWLELQERFMATKSSCSNGLLEGHALTNNDLYGFQIGAETRMWDGGGAFHVDAWIKAGIYGNSAESQTDTSLTNCPRRRSRSRAAFEGEIGLVGVLQVTPRLAVRGGYEVMWLDGVSLATDQVLDGGTGCGRGGIDASSTVFFHGAVVGAELRF